MREGQYLHSGTKCAPSKMTLTTATNEGGRWRWEKWSQKGQLCLKEAFQNQWRFIAFQKVLWKTVTPKLTSFLSAFSHKLGCSFCLQILIHHSFSSFFFLLFVSLLTLCASSAAPSPSCLDDIFKELEGPHNVFILCKDEGELRSGDCEKRKSANNHHLIRFTGH